MAKVKRRGPTIEEKYIGVKPEYHGVELPDDIKEREKEWRKGCQWFYYYQNNKKMEQTIIDYLIGELNWNKKQISNLKKVPSWKWRSRNYQGICMFNAGWTGEPLTSILSKINERLVEFEAEGQAIKQAEPKVERKPVIPPAELTRRKVLETMWGDWDEIIIEGHFDEDYTRKFNTYSRFKGHGLKGNAIKYFEDLLKREYEVISDAYNKTCEQAVEAYSHISKGNKRKIMKQYEDAFADIERLRDSFKAQRKPRAIKPKASDKQIEKLQYCKEDEDAKLTSINPILIPGKHKLFVYNRKNKKLIEYTCSSVDGFIVSGTSIKNFDDTSRQATLRKPDVVLPDILNRTEKQIDKIWETLTTKIDKPTGRINSDCILMRTF